MSAVNNEFHKPQEQDLAPQPPILFEACLARERQISVAKEIQEVVEKTLFVNHPAFVKSICHPKVLDELAVERYPYDFTIIQPGKTGIPEDQWRYEKAREAIRMLGNTDDRWLFFARWLKQEGVGEPEGIVPANILKRIYQRFARKERLSEKINRYTRLMEIWLPYFERLLTARRLLPQKNKGKDEELVKQGYQLTSVKASSGKRSTISATAAWLESTQRVGDARTVENAYSKAQMLRRKERQRWWGDSHSFTEPHSVK